MLATRRSPLFIACSTFAVAFVVATSPTSEGQEWTRFRGPNGTGYSEATTVPAAWTESDENWRVELPGIGHSSPVIWGDKIFLTSAFEDTATRIVFCLDKHSGAILWSKEYPSTVHAKHDRNSFASATPAVDDNRVYVAWSAPEEYSLLAFDHAGTELWRRNLGPYQSQHSCGTSPIVFENLVILGNDQDGASYLLAVNSANGDTVWQVERQTGMVAYSTPCIFEAKMWFPELIFNSKSHGISSLNPRTGELNWELPSAFDKRSVSSPVIAGGLVFGSCGSGGGGNYVVAVRPGSTEPSGKPSEAYRVEKSAPYVPTPVAKGELIFFWSDQGVVTCAKAATGEPVWVERVEGDFSGSPVLVGDKVYCISDDGKVVVLAAGETFELLGENDLGEPSRSTPAVDQGVMYLRTYSHLISVGG